MSPGLQRERTRLSWDRTALSFGAYGALLVHLGHGTVHPASLALGIATLVAGTVVYVMGRKRYRLRVTPESAASGDGDTMPCRPRALAAVTTIMVATTVLSGVEALLPR